MKANVYIDGFNLYYGALKGTPCKWLDLEALCRRLVSNYEIARIRYFTAKIKPRPDNPKSPARQDIYLRALATNPKISIHLGYFKESRVRMALATPRPGLPRIVEVLRTEEKGTDVNIATYLMLDVFRHDCDLSVVISNDADLAEPMRIVVAEFDHPVALINPFQTQSCRELRTVPTLFYKQIKKRALRQCQLPAKLRDESGEIPRPREW
ncbi:MAG: NYN domain-containing protein [Nocardiopsaceae bacterium]|nr:NYN domain-containing protein [Nocardiopsaceae bacterium]